MRTPAPSPSALPRGEASASTAHGAIWAGVGQVHEVGNLQDHLRYARMLHLVLCAHLDTVGNLVAGGGQRGAAKRIAILALGLEIGRGAARPLALRLAARAVAEGLGLTPGMTRKAASQARALLDFGLPDLDIATERAAGHGPQALIERLDVRVDAVRVRSATDARAVAFELGRREGDAGEPGDGIERLERRAEAGDAEAARMLRGVAQRLRRWLQDPS